MHESNTGEARALQDPKCLRALPALPRSRSYLLITRLDNPSEAGTLGLAATAGSPNEEVEPDRYKSAIPGTFK